MVHILDLVLQQAQDSLYHDGEDLVLYKVFFLLESFGRHDTSNVAHHAQILGPNVGFDPASWRTQLRDHDENFVTAFEIVDCHIVVFTVWGVIDRGIKTPQESCNAKTAHFGILNAHLGIVSLLQQSGHSCTFLLIRYISVSVMMYPEPNSSCFISVRMACSRFSGGFSFGSAAAAYAADFPFPFLASWTPPFEVCWWLSAGLCASSMSWLALRNFLRMIYLSPRPKIGCLSCSPACSIAGSPFLRSQCSTSLLVNYKKCKIALTPFFLVKFLWCILNSFFSSSV